MKDVPTAVMTPGTGTAGKIDQTCRRLGAHTSQRDDLMRSVELFSGCGGLALGLARAAFRHARMVEWNSEACATLAANKAGGVEHALEWEVIPGDVREMRWTNLNNVELVAGGPPCQPFSIGGKHRGRLDGRDMWPEAIRAVREISPRAFLFENVSGLTRPAFADYLQWITDSLSSPQDPPLAVGLGRRATARHVLEADDEHYNVVVVRVNAADFGAAQKRHRVVLAGVRRDLNVEIG